MAEQQAAGAEARLADARSAVHTAEQRAAALSKDLEDARSATEVRCLPSDSPSENLYFQTTSRVTCAITRETSVRLTGCFHSKTNSLHELLWQLREPTQAQANPLVTARPSRESSGSKPSPRC